MHLATATGFADPTKAVVAELLAGSDPNGADREFLAWTEGMLTAAAIGPERSRPGDWLELVFGRGHVFESRAHAQTCMSGFAMMYNTIHTDLERKGPDYRPHFLDIAADGEEVALATRWADGFLAGVQRHGEAWRQLLESPQGKLSLAPIVAFMTGADGKGPILHQPAEKLAEIRRQSLSWLGTAVVEINEYWRTVAGRPVSASDAVRKIGRNDPCPCGSGKKYKKCCLDRK